MAIVGIPHHRVVIQNLYSSKSNWNKALRHGYTIAQARSDVLFSLLFGGQVCFSAGAFFDSLIAIRVFGELCSHPEFDGFCQDYGWRPLWLNTDRRLDPNVDLHSHLSPIDFILSRWRNEKMSFTFFREFEPGFDDPARTWRMKLAASSALEAKQYGSMADHLAPLFQEHKIERFDSAVFRADVDPAPAVDDTSQTWEALARGAAVLPAILTDDAGKWIKSLIEYLTTYKMFQNRDATERPGALDEFSPLNAVIERTRNIDGTSPQYSKDELETLNESFREKFGNQPTMNPIHNDGPAHYGPVYYPLIDYWMETEWHEVRHRMYGAKSCILSSDWHNREVFDFDRTSKATYLRDVRIDDSLRVTQEGFGQIAWDVLFATVTDSKWRKLLIQLRAEADRDRRRAHAEAILNLLASKLSDFHFEHENGILSISMKRAASLSYIAAYAGMVVKHHNTLEGLLGTQLTQLLEVAALPIGVAVSESKPVAQILQPLAKGAKYAFGLYKGRQLRRAIIPDIYGV